MGIQKTLEITFRPDGTVYLLHNFYNRNDHPIRGASWAINSLDASGEIEFSYAGGKTGDFYPGTTVALWGQTSMDDPRLTYYPDRIRAAYLPISDYFKLGVYCPDGKAILESKGQRLTMGFDAPDIRTLPDQGCNFELYMHKMFLEMESLGPVTDIAPGESASHWETWKLEEI